MKAFSGEQLKKVELALKRSTVSKRLLASAGALAIMVPVVGCGESGDSTKTNRANEAGNTPSLSGDRHKDGPIERSGLKPTPNTPSEPSQEDNSGEDFKIPKTSFIEVSDTDLDDISRDYEDTPGGFRERAENYPVLGTDVTLEKLEEDCQTSANKNFENLLSVEEGNSPPHKDASTGASGIVKFIDEDGRYSTYGCIATAAQEMYGDALTQGQ